MKEGVYVIDEETRKHLEIGRRIEEARKHAGLTQSELGDKLGMNKSSIQRYETGQVKKIKIPVIDTIAKVLKVNPAWLALKTDDPKIDDTSLDQFSEFTKKFSMLSEENKQRVVGYIDALLK